MKEKRLTNQNIKVTKTSYNLSTALISIFIKDNVNTSWVSAQTTRPQILSLYDNKWDVTDKERYLNEA